MVFLGAKTSSVHDVQWACPEDDVRRARRNPEHEQKKAFEEKISSKPVFLFAYLFRGGVLGPHLFTYYRGGAGQYVGTKISPSDPFLGKKKEKV